MKQLISAAFFLACAFTFSATGQVKDKRCDLECSKRIQTILGSLPKDSEFYMTLKYGQLGAFVHEEWMDEFVKFGLKHVQFEFVYESSASGIEWKLKSTLYLSKYFGTDTRLSVPKLRLLRQSGLDKRLLAAAKQRAERILYLGNERATQINSGEKAQVRKTCGTIIINLLDYEALPSMNTISDEEGLCR